MMLDPYTYGTPAPLTCKLWEFNGSNENIAIFFDEVVPSDYQSIGNNNDYTVLVWVNTSDTTGSGLYWFGDQSIIELRKKGSLGNRVPFFLGVENNKFQVGRTTNDIATPERKLSTSTINDGSKHLLGAVFSGDDVDLYIDGVLDSSHTFTIATGDTSVGSSKAHLSIGARVTAVNTYTYFYSGKIGTALILNDSISSINMLDYYNGDDSGISADIIGGWNPELSLDGVGGVVDSYGSNDGTFVNMTVADNVVDC